VNSRALFNVCFWDTYSCLCFACVFIFSFLGPAEVVAWGILGTVWNALGEVIGAVADSAEARCTFLLGIGEPLRAKLSCYKSMFIGFVFSTVVTSCILIAGEDFPTWMTSNPVLQNIVADLIPLFAIANIALGMNSMSSTLVGSQGRSRLATALSIAAIWVVSIPLTVLFSILMNIDLQGQTAAVAIGSMISSTLNTYILLQSDWDELSRKAISKIANENAEPNEDVATNDNASVSSSSSSDPTPSVASSSSSSDSGAPCAASVSESVQTNVLQSAAYGAYCTDTGLSGSFFQKSSMQSCIMN
jgi:phosphotransferase system  glucose/maltose/N-acetylglucosamine-specific IIC component